MSRIVFVLIALVFAVPALSQSREDGPAVEICAMNLVGYVVPDGLDPASDRFRSPDKWSLCPNCPAPPGKGVQPLAPADGATAVLFRPGGAPLTPFARPVERDCQSYDLGVVPFIAPHPSADAEWTLEESRRRLEARYCPYDTEDGKLCLSFVCTPEEEQWMLLAEGSVEGLDVTEALELELDVRVDGALAGYLTLSARAGFENAFFAVYVRQLDDELLGALRRGQAGTFRVRAMKQERELGMTLDGSSRALGAVLGNCGDLQRFATPDTAPDRFVLLNGPSTEAAMDAARQALDDRIGRLLALEGAPDPDVRRAVASRIRHVLVDEYQDVNLLQADLVEQFQSMHGNVLMVGDDAQSIYRFRGADVGHILDVPKRYNGARVLKLEHNYRLTQPILDLANHVLDKAVEKYDKRLFTDR